MVLGVAIRVEQIQFPALQWDSWTTVSPKGPLGWDSTDSALKNYVLFPFPRRCHRVTLTPVPPSPEYRAERAAGPGKGRAQGGALSEGEGGCQAQSQESQSGSSSLQPLPRGGCSHGSPLGKRSLLRSPHPSPTHCPQGCRDSLTVEQVWTVLLVGEPLEP